MNEKVIRIGIYLRLSNEDRNKKYKDDDSESIKNQRNIVNDYIKNHFQNALVNEYCDEDLSGAGTYRPEFERLIRDCENKKIDIVLCKSQSRFSRDMEIVEKYINNKFKEWNIRFIGISDNADTFIIGNKKSRQINGLVNEWYLEDVSNNIRSAFNSKMKQGDFISPFASYGYEIDPSNNNKLIIDKKASIIVKNIYNLYLKGFGFTTIANYLNDKCIPSPSLYKYKKGIKLNIISNKPREEIKWSANAIKRILTNEIYIGNLIQGKRTTINYKNHKIIKKDESEWIKVINTHDAIISEDIFNKVQTNIKERTKPIKKTGIVHLLSGKVFCMECNHCFRKKNTKLHEYLVCSNNNCINKSSIRYDELSNQLLLAINRKIETYYNEKELKHIYCKNIDNIFNNKIKYLNEEKNHIKKCIIKNKNYLKKLFEDKVNGNINIDEFNDLIEQFNNDKEKYNKENIYIDNKINYLKNKINNFNVDKLLEKYKNIKKLNRVIVDEFIDKIYIDKINYSTNSRNIYIKWNF